MFETKRPPYFITHSHKDNAFVSQLREDLEKNGLGGFLDFYEIKPGDPFVERIGRGLKECEVFMPVLSLAAQSSKFSELEIETAIAFNRDPKRNGRPRIIPLLVEDINISDWEPLLTTYQRINFLTMGYHDGLAELLSKHFNVANPKLPPPGKANELFVLGEAALSVEDCKNAADYFRRALVLKPSFSQAKEKLEEAEQLLARSCRKIQN